MAQPLLEIQANLCSVKQQKCPYSVGNIDKDTLLTV